MPRTFPGAIGGVGVIGGLFGAIEVFVIPTPRSVLVPLIATNISLLLLCTVWIHRARAGADIAVPRYLLAAGAHAVVLTLLMAWTDGRTAWVMMLALPVAGGIELGRRGALVGGVVGALGIIGNGLLADRVWGLFVDPTSIAGELATIGAVTWMSVTWALRIQYYERRSLHRQSMAAQARQRAIVDRHESEVERLRSSLIDEATPPLRQPLRAVNRAAQDLLVPRQDPEHSRRTLEDVRDRARHLGRLIDDLEMIAALDVDEVVPDVEVVRVRDAVSRATRVAGHVPVTVAGQDVALAVDPGLLDVVLCHLMRNAVDHGGQHVSVHWNTRRGMVEVVVADGGPGLPSDDVERAFAPFVVLGASREGQGLGLPIARRLSEVMGGSLDVSAVDGTGRFVLRLPQARVVGGVEPGTAGQHGGGGERG